MALIIFQFSLLHALPHYLGIIFIGKSMSLTPLTLIAPGVGFLFRCIYSTVTLHFSTVDMHAPFASLSIT